MLNINLKTINVIIRVFLASMYISMALFTNTYPIRGLINCGLQLPG